MSLRSIPSVHRAPAAARAPAAVGIVGTHAVALLPYWLAQTSAACPLVVASRHETVPTQQALEFSAVITSDLDDPAWLQTLRTQRTRADNAWPRLIGVCEANSASAAALCDATLPLPPMGVAEPPTAAAADAAPATRGTPLLAIVSDDARAATSLAERHPQTRVLYLPAAEDIEAVLGLPDLVCVLIDLELDTDRLALLGAIIGLQRPDVRRLGFQASAHMERGVHALARGWVSRIVAYPWDTPALLRAGMVRRMEQRSEAAFEEAIPVAPETVAKTDAANEGAAPSAIGSTLYGDTDDVADSGENSGWWNAFKRRVAAVRLLQRAAMSV